MDPEKFPECNATFGATQKQYRPLPAHKVGNEAQEAIFCWKLSFRERLRLVVTGRLWQHVATFGKPLMPQLFSAYKPEMRMPSERESKLIDRRRPDEEDPLRDEILVAVEKAGLSLHAKGLGRFSVLPGAEIPRIGDPPRTARSIVYTIKDSSSNSLVVFFPDSEKEKVIEWIEAYDESR